MGLDLYAGTLTRYYSGQWETIVQQSGRATGERTFVLRPPGGLVDADPSRAQQQVLEWRSRVSRDLAGVNALPEPLDWPEDLEQPYFTDKPDWPCFGALVLLAAYTDAGEPAPPSYLRTGSKTRLCDEWKVPPIRALTFDTRTCTLSIGGCQSGTFRFSILRLQSRSRSVLPRCRTSFTTCVTSTGGPIRSAQVNQGTSMWTCRRAKSAPLWRSRVQVLRSPCT